MKKTILLLLILTLASFNSNGQEYEKSGISFAVSSGAGFLILNQVNGGAYGQSPYDFKPSSLYWGASFEAKYRLHGFGIEYEEQKFGATRQEPQGLGVNITNMMRMEELKFNYFNLYYKFYIPFEYKNFNPYVKASLIIPIYGYTYDRTWDDAYTGKPGSDSYSNLGGLGGSIAFHVGANYQVNDNFSGFTELGVGPVIWKLGVRASFLK